MSTGERVAILIPTGHPLCATTWWPSGAVTGTVQKVYKNGKAAVAVDQLRNRSEDGRATMNFEFSYLSVIS